MNGTWDGVRDWLWHLVNDPIRTNPASAALAGIIVFGLPALVLVLTVATLVRRRPMLRRRKMDEQATTSQPEPGDPFAGQDGSGNAVPEADVEQEVGWRPGMTPTSLDTAAADQLFRGEALESRLRTTGFVRSVSDGADTGMTAGEFTKADAVQPEDSGVHVMPDLTPAADVHRMECPNCKGLGTVVKSTAELLRESLTHVADPDAMVTAFYRRLLEAAPDLASLFPPDLLTDDATAHQRDRLLRALQALAEMYEPNNPGKADRLTTALHTYGRSHAAFSRPDGTVRGATLEEYAAVKLALFTALMDAAGEAWAPAYGHAWSQVYDFAAAEMMAEQHRSGFVFPRQARS